MTAITQWARPKLRNVNREASAEAGRRHAVRQQNIVELANGLITELQAGVRVDSRAKEQLRRLRPVIIRILEL